MERLYALVKELPEIDESEKISDILFLTIERLSNSNEIDPRFDIGTPGPLVHTLEKLPNYSKGLVESIKRFPTPLTIWMINRILNVTDNKNEKLFWLSLLQETLKHALATDFVKEQAQNFIDYQLSRDSSLRSE